MTSLSIKSIALVLDLIFSFPAAQAQRPLQRRQLAAEVKAEFCHAWNRYNKYASGHDDLKPFSKTHHDWYEHPLLMTPVDALYTLIIMGFKEEAARTKHYILHNHSFDK